ncbi:DUF397 domain-containing protein [Actinoalloteichus caeruleus]|uniref:DUF397 domain-containing protein n=1 Tax=Actinoalloteichus cyanogriseus TaxID=2893586 RepID=UPI003AAC4C44
MTVHHEPEHWRKARRSRNGSARVEVGRFADGVAVRDTKDRAAGQVTVTGPRWSSFPRAIQAGRDDR